MSRHRSAALVSLLALAVVGCSKSSQDTTAPTTTTTTIPGSGLPALPAALPMQTGPATPLATAPPASRLPTPQRTVGLTRFANDGDAYAYLDRAADMQDEIGDAPPDYDYDYDHGVSPWVWETRGGDYQYAEPVDGGYRYYYYQPGADYPYLVRTGDRSYAYAAGALVAIYALNGALLPPDQYGRYRDQASRFFWRGQQLRQAANQRPHQGVNAANWAAQRPQIGAAQAGWATARSQQPAWQAYHAHNDPTQQPGWQQEHQQRQQVAQQFSGWQAHGLSGPPPKALAVPGARAAAPRPAPAIGNPAAAPVHPALTGAEPVRGQVPGRISGAPNAAPPAAREQHPAAPAAGQHQAETNPNLPHDATPAHHQEPAQQEAAARQQQVANVHRQQDNAAQAQVAGRLQAQQREAAMAAQQAQRHAVAAQRQAETARVQAAHNPAVERERAPIAPPMRERPPEMAPRPEARAPAPAPRPVEARPPVPAPHPVEVHAPAPHPEAPHPEPAHPAPGH